MEEKRAEKESKGSVFWRNVWECFRRSVTPFLMYLFMSLIALACQGLSAQWLKILIGTVCIAVGGFFNGHLLFHFGSAHYGEYLVAKARERNALFGVSTGGKVHPEREYRPWKGFAIGAFVGLPVLLFGTLAGAFKGTDGGRVLYLILTLIAGWASIPLSWFGSRYNDNGESLGLIASPFYALLFVLLPVAVSGVFYIVGAMHEKRVRLEAEERAERVRQAREQARKEREEHVRVQTEEQKKKTLQSKKKK